MLWVELTTPGGDTTWENLATYRTMRRIVPGNGEAVTHLIGLGADMEGQPVVTTVKETPEEILKAAGVAKKAGMTPSGVGFLPRASS